MQRFAVFIAVSSFLLVAYYPLTQAQDLFNRSTQQTEKPFISKNKASPELFVRSKNSGNYRKNSHKSGGLSKSRNKKDVNIPSTWKALSESARASREADMATAIMMTRKITQKLAEDNQKRMAGNTQQGGYSAFAQKQSNSMQKAKPKTRTQSVGGNTIINKKDEPKDKKPVQLFNSSTY